MVCDIITLAKKYVVAKKVCRSKVFARQFLKTLNVVFTTQARHNRMWMRGGKLKNEAEIRKQLIDNATCIVAKGGFEEATGRSFTKFSGMLGNSSYRTRRNADIMYGFIIPYISVVLYWPITKKPSPG